MTKKIEFGIDAPHIEGQMELDEVAHLDEARTKEERYPTTQTRRPLTAKEAVRAKLTEGDQS
jgi:hypothetical protein